MRRLPRGFFPERLPEPGELVRVRLRHWLVEEVAPPLAPEQSARVKLACADDDAQGRTTEVFWTARSTAASGSARAGPTSPLAASMRRDGSRRPSCPLWGPHDE